MTVDIESVVLRLSLDSLQDLLGRDVLDLVAHLNERLIESRSLKRLVLGVDNGLTLINSESGWTSVVEVLSQQDASDLCTLLNFGAGNSYELLQANVFRDLSEAQQTKVLNFFGIRQEADVHLTKIAAVTPVVPGYSLFDHQRLPAARVMEELSRGPNRVILHLPTGGGKTRTSMVVVCRWLIRNPGKSIVWLANSRELLEQAAEEFERAWKYLGDREVAIRRVWGSDDFAAVDYSDTFVVAGLAKLSSLSVRSPLDLAPLIVKNSLIVFDEAHQILAPTYFSLVQFLSREETGFPLLGLTATPGRTPENDLEDEELAELFDYNKVTIEMPGYANPVDYLVEQGYLAQAKFIDLKFESRKFVPSLNDEEREFSQDFLIQIGKDQARNAELIKAVRALAERHERILVFAPSVESAHQIGLVLRALGLDAFSLDGTTSDLARSSIITKFRGNSPGVQVLCNFGVLTTGFDAPRTSCVVIGRPTKSVVLYSQMVGRAIRGPRVGGNRNADVVTVVDTSLSGFGAVSEGFNYWDKKWWD